PLSLLRVSDYGIRFGRLVRLNWRSTRPCPVSKLWLVHSVLIARIIAGAAEPDKDLSRPSDLLRGTNLWTVHFKFAPKQWEAMEPVQAGPRGFAGPGGPAGFGPAMFVAPALLQQGDQNGDGKLSKEEFRALGGKWFAEWDKAKRGKLDADQLRAGLNSTLGQPNIGPPGAGGPGGRGMNLQGAEGRRNGLAS